MEQNESFIAKTCEICGGSDMGYALSELHLICGYGSKNDGEEIRLAFKDGRVTVIPKRSGGFKLISEAKSLEAAKELCFEAQSYLK